LIQRFVTRLAGLFVLPLSAAMSQSDSTRAKDSTAAQSPQSLTRIIVSASREPMSLRRLGVSASLLTGADFKVEPSFTAADAVSRMPGVFMDANAGPGGPNNIRLRGADESFTKVLMDGVEVNVSGGPFRFQGITAGNVDRVELVRGPQSAMHGSNAMAGVVQYFTAKGQPGKPRWTLESMGGGAALHGAHSGVSAAVGGGSDVFRYSAGGGVMYDAGIYDVKHNLRTREASTRVDYNASRALSLSGTLRYNHMESQLPVRNPGITRAPLDPNQRDENHMLVTGLTATLSPSPAWTHQLHLGVFQNIFSYTDQLDVVPPPSVGYFNGDAYISTDLTRSTLSYDATRRFSSKAGRAASFTVGGFAERETTGDTVGGAFGSGFTPQHRNQASLLSEVSASLGSAVSLLGGARFQFYDGLGWAAVPRASLRVEVIPDRLSFRAAVGRGFKAPNIEQQYTANAFIIANPNLKPETSWSGELGGTFMTENGLQVSLTYFRQRFYDLIRVVPAPAPETRFVSDNLGRSDANGVEIDAAWTLPRGVTASGNIALVRTKIVDNAGLSPSQFPVDSALPSRPAFTGGGALSVPFGRWHALVRTTVVGRNIVLSEIFSGTRETLDPYALFGLTLTRDVSRGMALFTRGDNLLNTSYPAGFDRRGIPRTWTVGFRLTN